MENLSETSSNAILPHLASILAHDNWRVRVAGLNVMSAFVHKGWRKNQKINTVLTVVIEIP